MILAGGLATLSGCAASPTNDYRLRVIPGAILPGRSIIAVRGISIPGYLDQTGIQRPSTGDQFATFANELWAEPLADLLQGTMVQELAQRLPGATVLGSGSAIGAPPDKTVEINILRFDAGADGQLVLLAQIAVKSTGPNASWTKQNFTAAAPASTDPAGTVAVMSTLWAQAADQTAALLTGPAAP